MAAAVVVFLVCGAVSWLGWTPLSWPPRAINSFVPVGDSQFAGFTVVGPVFVMVAMFFLRSGLRKGLQRVVPRLPEGSRFLAVPAIATMLFGMSWAGAHQVTPNTVGVLPQIIFPAVVGLFAFGTARFGSGIQTVLRAFFMFRDRIPRWLRDVFVVAIPTLVSIALTTVFIVSQRALKEQMVVLVSLVAAFVATAPSAIATHARGSNARDDGRRRDKVVGR